MQITDSTSGVSQPSYRLEDLTKISALQKVFRDDFATTDISPNWQIIQQGAGQTIDTSSASELKLVLGTNANAQTILRSKVSFQMPFKVGAIIKASQRIANNSMIIEVVSEDGVDFARWTLDGTSNTTATVLTANNSSVGIAASMGSDSSTSYGLYEIEPCIDEVWFSTRAVDNGTARYNSTFRNYRIPDPSKEYYIQIRILNGATAPSSSTTFSIDNISVMDTTELNADVSGRGDASTGRAVSVVVGSNVNMYPVALASTVDSTTNQTANQTSAFSAKDATLSPQVKELVVTCYSDQAATLNVQGSTDGGTTWVNLATTPVTAGMASHLVVPISGIRHYRVSTTMGATASTKFVVASRFRYF